MKGEGRFAMFCGILEIYDVLNCEIYGDGNRQSAGAQLCGSSVVCTTYRGVTAECGVVTAL